MATLTFELPAQRDQTALNLCRWNELLADRELAKFEGRVETDRHGHIIMSPPPAARHGRFQARIVRLLGSLLSEEGVLTECPISTADGVKAADIAWASPARMRELGEQTCFPHAPEICVEVLSPSNTKAEIQEKQRLYFDAGAAEVWLCDEAGAMTFFSGNAAKPAHASKLCPKFPVRIRLG